MDRVTSRDGTSIAYDRQGSGPAVILVGGALLDPVTGRAGRAENEPLAAELARSFTVYNYDRRGRADSTDTPPYALEREFEDLDALITEAGGSAHVHGVSSGGALALEAAAAGLPIGRLSVYEVPYDLAHNGTARHQAYVENLHALLADGRRGDAIALFMTMAGSDQEMIEGARNSPMWPGLEAIAHTLAYDAACMGTGDLPTTRLATITQPTLVATGDAGAFFAPAADALAAGIPAAQRQTLESQGHVADADTIAPALERFFLTA